MKQFPVFFCILVFSCLCVGLSSCRTSHQSGGWVLTWQEEFDNPTLDSNVWQKIPRSKVAWCKYMSAFDSCYAWRDGKMVLRGIHNYSQPNDTAPYLTGGIYTRNKKTFSRGRLEICARLQAAEGAWPAIWMLPENAKWPHGGEIDIMERLNYDTIAYQTVHSNYTYNLGIKTNPPSHAVGGINLDDFNVFAVEMYPDSVAFFINEHHTFTYPRITTDKEGQFPFDQPYYLLIDMQLGGPWVGPVAGNDLPVEMEIDWVRFYQPKDAIQRLSQP